MLGIVIAFEDYQNVPKGAAANGFVQMIPQYFWNILKSPLPNVGGKSNILGNFLYLFKGNNAWIITRNTVAYNLVFIVIGLVLAVTFAIILSELRNRRTSKIYQSAMFLPYFLSWVVVSYLAFAMLSTNLGIINKGILEPLGIITPKTDLQFYALPGYWPFILIFFNIWKYTGYNCVIYLAALTAIDQELFEAAMIDGTTRMQRIRYITLPMLQPLMIILTVLAVGRIFNADFGLFYQVTRNQGALFNATAVIDTYVFNALRQQNDIGMSSAAGLYQSVVGFIFVFSANWFVRSIDREKAVF
jgi:putative aldouronate transport system permease protein